MDQKGQKQVFKKKSGKKLGSFLLLWRHGGDMKKEQAHGHIESANDNLMI